MDKEIDIEASLAALDRQNAKGAVKVWEDLDRYRTIIEQTRPDIVVECGTWHGDSALWFASLGVQVVTIDVDHDMVSSAARSHPFITILTGDSVSESVVNRIAELVGNSRTMVVLDSNHEPQHVSREIEYYGPMVTPGCHLVVEDGLIRYLGLFAEPMPGPLDAVEVLLVDNPWWKRDIAIEALHPVTMHPAGWWRRI